MHSMYMEYGARVNVAGAMQVIKTPVINANPTMVLDATDEA